MGDRLLFTDEVARLAGVAPRTITLYHRISRRRAEAGERLGPGDFPPADPGHYVKAERGGPDRPRWPRSVIRAWLRHRRRPGGQPGGTWGAR